jgi:uncharacterized protein (TIRG00374 family)
MKARLLALSKLALSLGLAWYALSRVDLAGAVGHIATLNIRWMLASISLVLAQFVFASIRYRRILSVANFKLSAKIAFENVMIGAFFSQTLASFIGGDAMRIWRVIRSGVPISLAAYSVLLDRAFGFVGLAVLIALGLGLFFHFVSDTWVRGALVFLVISVFVASGVLAWIGKPHAVSIQHPVFRRLRELAQLWRKQLQNTQSAALLFLISIGIQALNVLSVYGAARSLGMSLDLFACMALLPPVLFLAMLPISFAGWGVRESAMMVALGLIGLEPSKAVAISVCYGLIVLAASLPGGLIWLWDRRSAPIAPSMKDAGHR